MIDNKLTLPCDVNQVSDGYHTFAELYEHRCALMVALMMAHKSNAWWSEFHHDGSKFDGWIIVGLNLPDGPITYHIPEKWVTSLNRIVQMVRAPEWDGHTSSDVIIRLLAFINQAHK